MHEQVCASRTPSSIARDQPILTLAPPHFPPCVSSERLRREALGEVGDGLLELLLQVLLELARLLDLVQDALLVGAHVVDQVGLPRQDLVDRDVVQDTVDTGVDERHHLGDGHGRVLLLLEQLGETLATVERLLGGSVQVGAELREGSDLTVLSQEELEGTGDLLHGLELSGRTHTGHRQTDVDSRADTLLKNPKNQQKFQSIFKNFALT